MCYSLRFLGFLLLSQILTPHAPPTALDTDHYVDNHSYRYPHQEFYMKTVQMTLDEELVRSVDRTVKKLRTTRSEFTRMALREAIAQYEVRQLEIKHREGYAKHPVSPDEFSLWEDEQEWGTE